MSEQIIAIKIAFWLRAMSNKFHSPNQLVSIRQIVMKNSETPILHYSRSYAYGIVFLLIYSYYHLELLGCFGICCSCALTSFHLSVRGAEKSFITRLLTVTRIQGKVFMTIGLYKLISIRYIYEIRQVIVHFFIAGLLIK